jgi:hypothetical protein
MSEFKDPLLNLTRNQKHILHFLWIQHQHFLNGKHKPSDFKIARTIIAYCDKNPDNYDKKEISFILSAVKLNLTKLGVDILVCYYRRRDLGLIGRLNFE